MQQLIPSAEHVTILKISSHQKGQIYARLLFILSRILYILYRGLVVSAKQRSAMPLNTKQCKLSCTHGIFQLLSVPFCVRKYCFLRISFRYSPSKQFVKLPMPSRFSFPGLLGHPPTRIGLDCNLLPETFFFLTLWLAFGS